MAYSDEYRGNIYESWNVRLYYDAEGSNEWTGVSTDGDVHKVSGYIINSYNPVITNKPSIRRSIDLAKSKAKTGNLSLKLINFKYKGKSFSEELLGGSRKYINRKVEVYSRLVIEEQLIYTGRLIDLSHDLDSISLTITDKQTTDFISVPTEISTQNIHPPLAYGEFEGTDPRFNLSSSRLAGFPIDNPKLYPATFLGSQDGRYYYGTTSSFTSAQEKPHYYDKTARIFIPLTEMTSNTATFNGVDSLNIDAKFKRETHLNPSSVEQGEKDDPSTEDWANLSFITNTNYTTNKATCNVASGVGVWGGTPEGFSEVNINIPIFDGKVTEFKIYVRAKMVSNGGNGNGMQHWMKIDPSGVAKKILHLTTIGTGYGGSGEQSAETWSAHNSDGGVTQMDGYADDYDIVDLLPTYTANDNTMPDKVVIRLGCQHNTSNGSGSGNSDGEIYDCYFKFTIENDSDNEPTATYEKISKEIIYMPFNGKTESWSSSGAYRPYDIHRDLLYRYTGYTTEPSNYGDINVSSGGRANWRMLVGEPKPVDLQKTLDKIQKEGAFCFLWDKSGNGKYVYVKTSYSSSDVSSTLDINDISSLNISKSPFSELLTKMSLSWLKHPAEDNYRQRDDSSYVNSTARTNWNIQAKENIKEEKLEYLRTTGGTNGTNVDEYWNYYNSVFGDVKIIVKCNIVNPAKMDLDVGDIVKFDLDTKAFGYSWTKYFMITSLTRKIGEMSIECREVG